MLTNPGSLRSPSLSRTGLRIALGFGTVFGVRTWAWFRREDGNIFLGMEENKMENMKRLGLKGMGTGGGVGGGGGG